MAAQDSEIRYLTAPSIDTKKKKYCRFKKSGIKYIDYKDPDRGQFPGECHHILHGRFRFRPHQRFFQPGQCFQCRQRNEHPQIALQH